jgi:aspartate aminotransferase
MKTMSARMNQMRQALFQKLSILNAPGNWEHILRSVGLFCFTGLSGIIFFLL